MVDGRHTDVVSILIQWMFKSSLDNHTARIREQRTPALAWVTVRERQRGREERETTQEVKLVNQSALYQKSYLSCSLNYSTEIPGEETQD